MPREVPTVYGWRDGDGWFLSRFPYEDGIKPVNLYETQQDAIRAASKKSMKIKWQEIPSDHIPQNGNG